MIVPQNFDDLLESLDELVMFLMAEDHFKIALTGKSLENDITQACHDVMVNGLSVREAAEKHGVDVNHTSRTIRNLQANFFKTIGEGGFDCFPVVVPKKLAASFKEFEEFSNRAIIPNKIRPRKPRDAKKPRGKKAGKLRKK